MQKQGQKLLAALNLPQVGNITLLAEDAAGMMTVYEAFEVSSLADGRSFCAPPRVVERRRPWTVHYRAE